MLDATMFDDDDDDYDDDDEEYNSVVPTRAERLRRRSAGRRTPFIVEDILRGARHVSSRFYTFVFFSFLAARTSLDNSEGGWLIAGRFCKIILTRMCANRRATKCICAVGAAISIKKKLRVLKLCVSLKF